MNNNHKKLLNLFEKIHSEKKNESGYSLGKSTILKVFKATDGYSHEDILARLTNYNKFLTKKAIFMQKLIHIHQCKVDYC